MHKSIRIVPILFAVALLAPVLQLPLLAQDPCERFPAGSTVKEPENLFSKNGLLKVDLTYQSSRDEAGIERFCFVNSDGAESPTLHVRPGDILVLTLTNLVPEKSGAVAGMPAMDMAHAGEGGCGAMNMTPSSVNIHYHGTNTPPICHQDEVIHTIINSGQTFRYEVHFPVDEPPGLYWYHPHIHGISEKAVQGGATGAIVVEGIGKVNSAVAGLPRRLLVVRDRPAVHPSGPDAPTYDLSLNYIPVFYPEYIPAVLPMKPGEKQFLRVLNSSADTILDLQLIYDGEPQTLHVIALDGVPTGSQDGSGVGKTLTREHLLIPPAARAEFIVTGPTKQVRDAQLITRKVNTGPGGDSDPTRPLLTIDTSDSAAATAASAQLTAEPVETGLPPAERFAGLASATPTQNRKLYFSEDKTHFFITVDGQKPKPYRMNEPPAIVTRQGTVEDWTIQNRSPENHEFHIHQIHFEVLARNGSPVSDKERQFLDTIDIPFWPGHGPYPSVTLRMDFRGPDVGDFVYHCHILEHEDAGMMAIIRVLPRNAAPAALTSKAPGAIQTAQSAVASKR